MTFEEFIELLPGGILNPRGDSFLTNCPAHDDRNPSLSVRDGGDKILVFCHAGCSVFDVCDSLGLSVGDLRYEKEVEVKVIAKYDYVDEKGYRLFSIWRTDPKGFQWHWAENYNPEHRKVPYNLPRILSVGFRETVYIVEGEKDADRLIQLGYTATTFPGSKLEPEYIKFFLHTQVVIVQDRDSVGTDKARRIYDSLVPGVARSAMIVEAAEGNDVSDHLDAGYPIKDLKEVQV